jgi:hypothetical protein
LKEQAMQRTENDSADKKNWMSSAQLWSNGTTCDYKKEDSASESKLVIFENLKMTNSFWGFWGLKFLIFVFVFFIIARRRRRSVCAGEPGSAME